MARAFSSMKVRPRRSILFLAVTAEEAGLLGSDYFAHYPTVPKNAIVADVNTDEDPMFWPLADIIAFGANIPPSQAPSIALASACTSPRVTILFPSRSSSSAAISIRS